MNKELSIKNNISEYILKLKLIKGNTKIRDIHYKPTEIIVPNNINT